MRPSFEESSLINEALQHRFAGTRENALVVHSDDLTLLRRGTHLVYRDENLGLIYRLGDPEVMSPAEKQENLELIDMLARVDIADSSADTGDDEDDGDIRSVAEKEGGTREYAPVASRAVSPPVGSACIPARTVDVWEAHDTTDIGYLELGEALARLHTAVDRLRDEHRARVPEFRLERRFSRRLANISSRLDRRLVRFLERLSRDALTVYDDHMRTTKPRIVHADAHIGNVVRNRSTAIPEMVDLDGLCFSAREMDLVPTDIACRRFSGDEDDWKQFCAGYAVGSAGSSAGTFDMAKIEGLASMKEAMILTWLADQAVRQRDRALFSELEHRIDSWSDPNARWHRV